MVPLIDNNTTAMLGLALDAAVMRQQAIAQNIANVSTPGYQRIGVSFESRMAALASSLPQGAAPSLADLSNYRPFFEATGAPGDSVALDMEMADMSQTVLHHQVLMKALNKHLELVGLAINEGKR